ncbi:MAG: hypothetical protein ABJF23_00265 [Bryobacteraceae bacterium]
MSQSAADETNPFLRRFVFHGNAAAAGVVLTKIGKIPQDKPIPVHGQSALPVTGGHSESFVAGSDPSFAGIFSYGECRTQVDGVLREQTATTTLRVSLEKIRLINRPSDDEDPHPRDIEFVASALSLQMRSTHGAQGQPSIEFVEKPKFEGMFLEGRPIHLELRPQFLELTRMADLEKRFKEDRNFFSDCRLWFMRGPRQPKPSFGKNIPRVNGYAVSSIVRSIRWGNEAIEGHILRRKGFGAIYFGEVLINEYNRRLTLVRVQMGSQNELRGAFVEGDANGSWWPPS